MGEPKHILVVEDDDGVRQVLTDFLLHLGYRVSVADDGASMRAHLELSDPIDIVLLDVNIPGESSLGLVQHIKASGVKLVTISGDVDQAEFARQAAAPFLKKPFRMAQLQSAIEEV